MPDEIFGKERRKLPVRATGAFAATRTDDETRSYVETGRVDPMHALGNVPPRILLFAHRDERLRMSIAARLAAR